MSTNIRCVLVMNHKPAGNQEPAGNQTLRKRLNLKHFWQSEHTGQILTTSRQRMKHHARNHPMSNTRGWMNNAYPRYTTLIGHRLGVTHISHATGDPNKPPRARARPTEMPMGLSPCKRQVKQSNASRERISSARRGGGHGYLLNPQTAQTAN